MPTVAAGPLKATLAPEVGGRIVGLTCYGVELLWSDLAGRGGPRAPFPLPGGDKVWLAPQAAWPDQRPYPILDLGSWSWDGVRMTSPWEPSLGVRLVRSVFADGDELVVETVLEGDPARPLGLWHVTQLRLPGVARLPTDELRPGGEGRESEARPRQLDGAAEVATAGGGPWKLSSAEPCAWVEAEVAGVRLRRTLESGAPGAGEVYDSDDLGYWELELHSAPGERIHRERWSAARLDP